MTIKIKKGKYGKGKTVIIDDEDCSIFSKYPWWINKDDYLTVCTGPRKKRIRFKFHRLLMSAPKGLTVDHINGNRLDNRKSNLRLCDQAQNTANSRKKKNNRSGYKGVCWHKAAKKWRAHICHNYQIYHLGLFTDKKEAAKAYDQAALKYFGEFACLNLPLPPPPV